MKTYMESKCEPRWDKEYERKKQKAMIYIVAMVVMLFGVFFMMSSVGGGIFMIAIGIVAIIWSNIYYKKPEKK